MYKFIWQLTVSLLFYPALFAQQGHKLLTITSQQKNIATAPDAGHCGVDMSLMLLRNNATFKSREAKMNRELLSFQRPLVEDSVVVPVVFHIINDLPSEISDQLILSALQELNDAFARRGAYAGSKGVDTKIRFCLAQKDPDGGNTTGITRTKSFFSNHLNPLIEDARLKNLIQWDPSRYINIWYIKSVDMESSAEFVCGQWTRLMSEGYATMPPGGGPLDGIVLPEFGKLLVHEMGHYLGLYHTYEGRDCNNNDCTTDGDRVCDTPPDRSLNNSLTCTDPQNSCNTDTLSNDSNGEFSSDVPDQVENFMDNSNEACKDQFTQGQADRMHATIQTQRKGLLENECDKPCAENIKASFSRDKAYPLPGDAITFTNSSDGASRYQWLVDGEVVSSSANFTHAFAAPGKYKVTLKAYNNEACFALYSDFIIVNCGVIARFYSRKRTIASKLPLHPDTIYFTNSSENANSFRWLLSSDAGMEEQQVSTAKDLEYIFPSPGNYSLRLIATNGTCTDTTEIFTIPVLDPTQDGIAYMSAVDCYEQTKVKVSFYICNAGFATIPRNVPVSFYDADPRQGNARKLGTDFFIPDSIPGKCCGILYTNIIDVRQPGLNVLYMVFNDAGTTMPLALPNTPLIESNYENNIAIANNFRFKVTPDPAEAVLEPGDTIQLSAKAGPGPVSSYNWSEAPKLSCTNCSSPYLIADSDRVKRVIATSQYGCVDTAYVDIRVPPANDYTIDLDDVRCASGDRFFVSFSLKNSFKRGVVPKGMTVSFYDKDPTEPTANLLPPVFTVPDTVFAKEGSFTAYIKGINEGRIYAMVNDSGTAVPVSLPNNSLLPEKNYLNNGAVFSYEPEPVQLVPADTTVLRKSSFPIRTSTMVYNPSSTTWSNGSGYTLNCNSCPDSVLVTVMENSVVTMQTENQYGCLIKGSAAIRIFPADMTVKVIETTCYSGSSTLVRFEICMNNNYDTLFEGIPVSFYDAIPSGGTSNLLSPVFYTPRLQAGNCFIYEHIVATPATGQLYAVVNDEGTGTRGMPGKVFNETDYDNNTANGSTTPFNVNIYPPDTTIGRSETAQLTATATGGILSTYQWKQDPFLSCLSCLTTQVTPLFTKEYMLIAQNEYACVDTAYAVVKTYTDGTINIPSAFSPNKDGLNDIFYVLAGKGITVVNDFSVYNRWGEKIFESKNFLPNDPRSGWNGMYRGREAAPGTYAYIIRLPDPNGKDRIFKGTVVLVR